MHFSLIRTHLSQPSTTLGWLCFGTRAVLWDDSFGGSYLYFRRGNGELLLDVTEESLCVCWLGAWFVSFESSRVDLAS